MGEGRERGGSGGCDPEECKAVRTGAGSARTESCAAELLAGDVWRAARGGDRSAEKASAALEKGSGQRRRSPIG